jgi:hypothetical protein
MLPLDVLIAFLIIDPVGDPEGILRVNLELLLFFAKVVCL